MSLLQKQTALGKNLYQINANSLRSLVELQRDNFEQYVELNKDYFGKLPQVGGIKNFLDLQREYNQDVWEGVKTSFQANTEIVKDAFKESSAAVRATYQQDESAADTVKDVKAAPVVKAAKKATAEPVAKDVVAAKPAAAKKGSS